jgi:hypothetical protein
MVLGIESLIVAVLLLGWFFGARRLNFNIHHAVVYTVILIHAVIVAVWMIPIAQIAISHGLLGDPIVNMGYILHFTIGMTADALSIILAVLFIVRRDMPLSLLRRARPLMFTTLILWIISYGLGLVNLLLR